MKQPQALDILKMKANVFLTGRAGSGKTYVLNEYIKYLKSNGIGVGITAATGIAATHLGGTTIHSWSGMGVKDKLTDEDVIKLLKKRYLRTHFLESSVLIIDEVSMLHAHQLDLVNFLCQAFRQSIQPFGGLQVILAGDFFQLPPVARAGNVAQFVTQSDIWSKMNLRVCYLDEQFRQEDDNFLNILNEIRAGSVSQQSRDFLFSRLNQPLSTGFEPTKLYTHNIDVDTINFSELEKVDGLMKSYSMESRGSKVLVEVLKNSCLAPESLMLKIGARVMFIKNNFELGVVNGTVGTVVGYDDFEYPIIKIKTGEKIVAEPSNWMIEEGGRTLAEIRQVPLRLAWAITVHKSQGMSLDMAEVDLSKSFEPGMGYVALSRIRTLAGLKLNGINEMAFKVNPQVLVFDKQLQQASNQNVHQLQSMSRQEIVNKQKEFIQVDGGKFKQKKFKKKKIPNREITFQMLQKKMILKQIADKQELTLGTIIKHVERLIKAGRDINILHLMPKQKDYQIIKSAFEKCGWERLTLVYEFLNEKYDYDTLRLVRLKYFQEN